MPQIGPLEILIVGVLALLVFGPERLPEIGRSVGKAFNQFKRMASDVKSEFDLGIEDEKDTARAVNRPDSNVPPAADVPENVPEDVPASEATDETQERQETAGSVAGS